MRVERMNATSTSLNVTARRQFQLKFQFTSDLPTIDDFCSTLTTRLAECSGYMKLLKKFVAILPSECLSLGKEMILNGLGAEHGYIGESKPAVEKSKLKHWALYFNSAGVNLSLIRMPSLVKLVRIGLPDSLRGELWETLSGSIHERYVHPEYYQTLLNQNAGVKSFSIDEIEKDLNRSLPEYKGFQDASGIDKLRRVLYAYSFHHPEIGYCQAMNMLASVFLIYLEEDAAFWLLVTLCNVKSPGYYTTNMFGAVVDQHVFESLVEKHVPILHAHLKTNDLQLSVACIPWFLTLYTNALPLHHAMRIIDVFWLEGPKILFQTGLAILKINGDAIMAVKDDGEMMNVFKKYFATLDSGLQSAGKTTLVNELMFTAYREFQYITNESISALRKNHGIGVAQHMDMWSKRAQVRDLKPGVFKKEELLFLCDTFYSVKQESTKIGLDLGEFEAFLLKCTKWRPDATLYKGLFKFFVGLPGKKDAVVNAGVQFYQLVDGLNLLLSADIHRSMSILSRAFTETEELRPSQYALFCDWLRKISLKDLSDIPELTILVTIDEAVQKLLCHPEIYQFFETAFKSTFILIDLSTGVQQKTLDVSSAFSSGLELSAFRIGQSNQYLQKEEKEEDGEQETEDLLLEGSISIDLVDMISGDTSATIPYKLVTE